MNNETEIIDHLVSEGIIGVGLGRLVSGNPTSELGVVAKAALLASYEARMNAQKTNIPIVVEENDALYEVHSDGSKKWLQDIPQSYRKLPKRFTLKP